MEVGDAGRLTRLEMVPVTLDVAAVNRAIGGIRDTINRRMIDRSRAFGAQLEETSDGLALDLRNQVPPA